MRIAAAPKIRQIYWCDLWNDAQLPEMWKRRPVVVISFRHRLNSVSLVIPTTTIDQTGNEWGHPLSVQVEEGRNSWAVCNQPSTVANSRFYPVKDGPIPLLPIADFNAILEKLNRWLPKPFEVPAQPPAAN
jgi:mRNA interferase MazF